MYRSGSSTVCIVTKVPPEWKRNRVSISRDASSFHPSPNRRNQHWDPPSLLFNGYWGSFPGMKWPRHETDYSPLVALRFTSAGNCTSIPSYMLMAWSLIGHVVTVDELCNSICTGWFMSYGHNCMRSFSRSLETKKFLLMWVLVSIVMVIWLLFNPLKRTAVNHRYS